MNFVCVTMLCMTSCTLGLSEDIPTVDLSKPETDCAKDLYDAANFGFFYLINHGIDKEITKFLLDTSKEFFSINDETKHNLKQNDTYWGYVGFEDELIDPSTQTSFDTKEGIYFHNSNSINDANQHANDDPNDHDLSKHNQWPPQDIFPNFKSIVEQYMTEMRALSDRLATIIALSLNISPNYFDQPGMFICLKCSLCIDIQYIQVYNDFNIIIA